MRIRKKGTRRGSLVFLKGSGAFEIEVRDLECKFGRRALFSGISFPVEKGETLNTMAGLGGDKEKSRGEK